MNTPCIYCKRKIDCNKKPVKTKTYEKRNKI